MDFLLFHVKHCSQGNRFSASGKRGFHPCFCLPACCNCPVALSELATLTLMIQLCLNLKILKHAIAAGKTDCKIEFAPQMWATRPHLASIFEKLLDQKTFQLPAAWDWKPHFQEYHLNPVRQNRFAVCLCAVRRCCVVRIAYESFLDCSLQEFLMFLEWRTAFAYFFQILNSSNQYLC